MGNRPELGWRHYRRLREQILAASDTCHWCGHPGADALDHLVPTSKGGARVDPANLAPIHGVAGCPSCGRKCNNEKGDDEAPAARLTTSRDWYSPLP
ncbi:HNH endonuclease [Streptomyces halstedii]|uniref:HNH endonuclease n=1 Tax=Streptomyces halstedii TaxID=1944 RepID=UPI003345AEEB